MRVRQERPRRWPADEKLEIVQETLIPGGVIANPSRRYGIGTGLPCTWWKAMLAPTAESLVAVEASP